MKFRLERSSVWALTGGHLQMNPWGVLLATAQVPPLRHGFPLHPSNTASQCRPAGGRKKKKLYLHIINLYNPTYLSFSFVHKLSIRCKYIVFPFLLFKCMISLFLFDKYIFSCCCNYAHFSPIWGINKAILFYCILFINVFAICFLATRCHCISHAEPFNSS